MPKKAKYYKMILRHVLQFHDKYPKFHTFKICLLLAFHLGSSAFDIINDVYLCLNYTILWKLGFLWPQSFILLNISTK